MGYKLPEKILSTAAEGKLRRVDNETHIVTLFAISFAPSRPLRQVSPTHSGRTESGLQPGRRSSCAFKAQHPGDAAHSGNAESNMGVELEPQFLRPLDDVTAMDTARKCLIFHLLTDTRDIYIEDRSGGFHERYCGQKTGQLVARKEGFSEMGFSRYTGVLRMTHDRFANLLRPSLLGKNFVSDEGMLLRAGIFFVIKIVQQTGDAVGLAQ